MARLSAWELVRASILWPHKNNQRTVGPCLTPNPAPLIVNVTTHPNLLISHLTTSLP